jgi:hypothetical protein
VTRKATEQAQCDGVQRLLNGDVVRRTWTTRFLSDLRQKGSYRVPVRLKLPEPSVWAAESPADTCYVPVVTFTLEKTSLSGFRVEVIYGAIDGIPESKTLIRVIQ